MQRNLRKLKELTPTEFENLLFDIAILQGMGNVTWRTPGADGGRDIEAVSFNLDLSGFHTRAKWFIECKRYTGSVDWPTIYGKLAYADSLQSDYLLICTSSKFTPTAITEVERWNSSRRYPQIRLWPGHEIEAQLLRFPDLMLKYALGATPSVPGKSFTQLALALSKCVSTHFGEVVFNDTPVSSMLQASQALADLLLRRMEALSRSPRIELSFANSPAILEGCIFNGDFSTVDEPGLRALAAYIFALVRQPITVRSMGQGICIVESTKGFGDVVSRYSEPLNAIAIWSDQEYSFSPGAIEVRQRP